MLAPLWLQPGLWALLMAALAFDLMDQPNQRGGFDS
jgi:hypothetical protein